MDHVIIIGAGAAGLIAARVLRSGGATVDVVEARERAGGRIFTIPPEGFSAPVDTGAEFIHGEPPLLKALVREAGVELRKGRGRMWSVSADGVSDNQPFDEEWEGFLSLLNKLEVDMPIGEFLNTRFKTDAHRALRESVVRFVQGFDAADSSKASAFALREEWAAEEDSLTGHHVVGGLSRIIDHLRDTCIGLGVRFHFSTHVNRVEWETGTVTVHTSAGMLRAPRCLITVPPAVIQAQRIVIDPFPAIHQHAISSIETGGVIKFLFEFNDAFWDSPVEKSIRQLPDMHFVFSDAFIPTWWSQNPDPVPLLTGWLSGPVTREISKSSGELIADAIISLAHIFHTGPDAIVKRVKASKVVNWVTDPLSLGAYAYRTVGIEHSLRLLSLPIADTIFFAGEAYHTGKEMGTVEAALASGKETAERLLKTV
jgi:monoamine oxidase